MVKWQINEVCALLKLVALNHGREFGRKRVKGDGGGRTARVSAEAGDVGVGARGCGSDARSGGRLPTGGASWDGLGSAVR